MAKAKQKSAKGIFTGLLIVCALLFGGYSFLWFQVAEAAKTSYVEELSKIGNDAEITPPEVTGFPGKMIVTKVREVIASDQGSLEINGLKATSWPLPNMPLTIETGELSLKSSTWLEGLSFDSFDAVMRVNDREVIFDDSTLKQRDFEAKVTGSVDISDQNAAVPDLLVSLANHKDLLSVLVDSGIIEEQAAAFIGFGMSALVNTETQRVEVPIYAKNGMINLGPLPIIKLPNNTESSLRRGNVTPTK